MSSNEHANIVGEIDSVTKLMDPMGKDEVMTTGSLIAVIQVVDSDKDEHELAVEFTYVDGQWVPKNPRFVVPDVHYEQSVLIQLFYNDGDNLPVVHKEVICPGCSKPMVWSTYAGGPYIGGYFCNNQARCGTALAQGARWFCQKCYNDFCPKCIPKPDGVPDEVGLMTFPASHLPCIAVSEGENRPASWTSMYNMGITMDGQPRAMMVLGMDSQVVTEAQAAMDNFESHMTKSNAIKGRLLDIDDDPNSTFTPITGIMAGERLGLKEAAAASGCNDMEAFGYAALEQGTQLSSGDPCGLDSDEAGAIVLYTMETELYPTMNRLLRNKARSDLKPFFPFIRLLLDAKKKIQKEHKCVWRGVKGDLRDQYPEGKEMYWWAFSSTTKKLDVLQSPMFLGTEGERTLFMIEAKNGIDIQRYSAIPGEHELLLFPGTKLKVKAALDLGSGLYQVHLKEMEVPVDLIH